MDAPIALKSQPRHRHSLELLG